MFVAGLNFSSEKNVVSTSGIKKEFKLAHINTHTHTNTHTHAQAHTQTHIKH